jgi:galactokinase
MALDFGVRVAASPRTDGVITARSLQCPGDAVGARIDVLDRPDGRVDDAVLRCRVRHVVTENARVLEVVSRLRGGRARDVGQAMLASHRSLRDDYEVSSPELDIAVSSAIDAGALGARITGGGFGGCAIALVEAGAVDAVTSAVAAAFAAREFGPPSVWPARAAAGARRL